MAKKRGESGLCLVVGVDKPSGMSSHDVVNRCRRIFGERRVGHTGTLDPLASGVLPVCVGPATRLDAYMVAHDKRYVVDVVFGASTDTDDCDGSVVREAVVPACIADVDFAKRHVAALVGRHRQLPPVYSAIKVNGEKACDAARKGRIIELEPRDVEVYSAELLKVFPGEEGRFVWRAAFHVSKGTYIRSLARDMGTSLGCPAHVGALKRVQAGMVGLDACVSLDTLEEIGLRAALDPVRLLGYRFAFLDGGTASLVANGGFLPADAVALCEHRLAASGFELCACTSGVRESCAPPDDFEIVSLVSDNKLVALYEYEAAKRRFRAKCVFQTGVLRGGDF